ncbi:MAG: oxidoreductase [Planctomycetes bacterium B3_Pla]|nr:MAG: oxidoreductase [Planctomycetes bacterium B3_Pla]
MQRAKNVTRRQLLKGSIGAATAFTIVPRRVLGGPNQTPPSETFCGALIGCGGRGNSTFNAMGLEAKKIAICDVKFVGRADNKTIYRDFRRVLERKDIDVVAIATPPHWHALISIAAMEAGKDVLCEKPMTRFIAEGRAVAEAEKRYKRIFQVGTFGRFGKSRDRGSIEIHKIMASGLLKNCKGVHIKSGGLKVKQWSGMVNAQPQPIPKSLDWDMYCGPSPLRPYHHHRHGGTHRGYWDYEGGGLTDMGQHHYDPVQWIYAKDHTSPVEIEAYAPPAHPEACGMWGWVELKYADGMTFVFDSQEWGEPYSRKESREVRLSDLSEQDQKKIKEMPDPEPLVNFAEAVKTRKRAGGNADVANRSATLMHLANIAIRTGRKLRYDPVKEEIIGDEEANRLVNPPMRAPWHL